MLSDTDRVKNWSDLGSLFLNPTTSTKAGSFTSSGFSDMSSDGSGITPPAPTGTVCFATYSGGSSNGELLIKRIYRYADSRQATVPPKKPTPEARDDLSFGLRGRMVDDVRMGIGKRVNVGGAPFNDPIEDDEKVDVIIREIYFVSSITGESTIELMDFGLELGITYCPVSHPCVLAVKTCSPLRGCIFEGDCLLSINDMDTAGLSSTDVFNLRPSTSSGATKFMVLSAIPDEDREDDENSQGSSSRIDVGCSGSVAEV
jgi:hypothetical protein